MSSTQVYSVCSFTPEQQSSIKSLEILHVFTRQQEAINMVKELVNSPIKSAPLSNLEQKKLEFLVNQLINIYGDNQDIITRRENLQGMEDLIPDINDTSMSLKYIMDKGQILSSRYVNNEFVNLITKFINQLHDLSNIMSQQDSAEVEEFAIGVIDISDEIGQILWNRQNSPITTNTVRQNDLSLPDGYIYMARNQMKVYCVLPSVLN
jgi:hypothetical protein